ncbi:hypothetical protein L6R53_20890 [Myxococcota bacterium]|nr:hypothetical protein [Myxococcota bacterium]
MASMGVRKLGPAPKGPQGKAPAAPARPAGPTPAGAASPAGKPTGKPAGKPAGKPVGKPAGKALSPVQQELARAQRQQEAEQARQAELSLLRDERDAARGEAQDLRDQLAQAGDLARQAQELRVALADRQAALEAARSEHRRLQQALALATGQPGHEPLAPLADRLAAADIRGPTETDALLRALADARLGADLVRHLAVPDPAGLAAWLDDRVVLLGGCADCPQAPGRVVLSVPPARCELCRGGDLRASQRRFLDGCLVNGLTRVVLVGGRAKELRLLQPLVEDRRLVVTLVPGHQLRDEERVAQDLAQARVVALWEGPGLDPAVAARYRTFEGPVVAVQAEGIGPLLDALARAFAAVLD